MKRPNLHKKKKEGVKNFIWNNVVYEWSLSWVVPIQK